MGGFSSISLPLSCSTLLHVSVAPCRLTLLMVTALLRAPSLGRRVSLLPSTLSWDALILPVFSYVPIQSLSFARRSCANCLRPELCTHLGMDSHCGLGSGLMLIGLSQSGSILRMGSGVNPTANHRVENRERVDFEKENWSTIARKWGEYLLITWFGTRMPANNNGNS